jgi:hypothetical protein
MYGAREIMASNFIKLPKHVYIKYCVFQAVEKAV